MSDRKQIVGWTEPAAPLPRQYVRFIAVFRNDDGTVTVEIRNEEANYNAITLPRDAWAMVLDDLSEEDDPSV